MSPKSFYEFLHSCDTSGIYLVSDIVFIKYQNCLAIFYNSYIFIINVISGMRVVLKAHSRISMQCMLMLLSLGLVKNRA